MNDFLKQLRSGGNKRFDKNRRSFENGPYRSTTDRQNGRDRKNPQYRKNFDNTGQFQAVKKTLETLVEGQTSLIEQVKRQSSAMERIAFALERLGEHYGLQVPAAPPVETVETTDAPPEPAPEQEENGTQAAPTDRESLLEMVVEKRNAGDSYEDIALYLEQNEVPTLSGKGQWRAQSVSRFYNQYVQQDA